MLLLCLKIFFVRILDVSLGTIRTLFTVKGKKIIASVIGFFEVLVWFLVVKEALNTDENSIFIAISYSLGFATGTYIGSYLSKESNTDLLFEKLAKELGLELFKLGAIKKEVAFLLSLDQMRYFEAIIIKKEEKTLLIALKNPFEKSYQETLKMIFSNFSIVFGLIKNRDFKAAISWLEREELLQKLLERIPNEIAKDSKEENSSILEFLKLILQEAVCKGVR